jgi:hypothetical protein
MNEVEVAEAGEVAGTSRIPVEDIAEADSTLVVEDTPVEGSTLAVVEVAVR